VLSTLLAACDSGAQIVDYGPQRGSSDVPTNTPVQITFDRPVNQRSVATRFRLSPAASGAIIWPHPDQLLFKHEPLKTETQYTVELQAGYSDAQGHVYSLRHWWSFRTETPPDLVSTSPGAGDRNVDPAGYLSLAFSRPMDVAALAGAVSISPDTPTSLRIDPGDDRRVVVAPRVLLQPGTAYTLAVGRGALDVDGNPLRAAAQVQFQTGPNRALRHWIGALTQPFGQHSGEGVWIVDENRFPRRISSAAGDGFSWSPDGLGVLLHLAGDRWATQAVGGSELELPFLADWAADLGGGRGFVYLRGDRLNLLDATGRTAELAGGVGEAALAPDAEQVAYTVPGTGSTAIMAIEVELRARYRLLSEPGRVADLAWSPDGLRLAYRTPALDPAVSEVRVLSLTGPGGAITVARADTTPPRWLDESHLVFATDVQTPTGTYSRAYRVSALAPGDVLPPAQRLPATGELDVRDPMPSPDGHQIAFLAGDGGNYELWLMNADGTGLVQLTAYDAAAFPYSVRALAWTPA